MKKINKSDKIKLIGALFILLAPITFGLTQTLFKDFLCDPGIADSCGFKNLGILAYGVYFALIPLSLGIICFIVGAFLGKRK